MSSILAIDPSGNFKEGYGTSGFCYMVNGEVKELFDLKASDYPVAEGYWNNHARLIDVFDPDYVVVEGYRLYNHRGMAASTQANSELETPQLIGVLKAHCFANNIPLHVQFASEVKSRWSDDVLVNLGILERKNNRLYINGEVTNDHKRDALRHAMHFERYGKKVDYVK